MTEVAFWILSLIRRFPNDWILDLFLNLDLLVVGVALAWMLTVPKEQRDMSVRQDEKSSTADRAYRRRVTASSARTNGPRRGGYGRVGCPAVPASRLAAETEAAATNKGGEIATKMHVRHSSHNSYQ